DMADMADMIMNLRCPTCQGVLIPAQSPEIALGCMKCDETFPIVNGIPRMISAAMRRAIGGECSMAAPEESAAPMTPAEPAAAAIDPMRVKTARSFGFEWSRFPEMRAEWENNFWDYMAPHTPGSFRRKRVLDAGCGAGRHAYYAAENGAEVWAIDIG